VRRSKPLSRLGCDREGAPRSGRTISDANSDGRGGAGAPGPGGLRRHLRRVAVHIGRGRLRSGDDAIFNSGGRGIGAEVATWLADEVRAGVVAAGT
jgi:hypothetical protein